MKKLNFEKKYMLKKKKKKAKEPRLWRILHVRVRSGDFFRSLVTDLE